MGRFLGRFQPTRGRDAELDEDLYAFAVYELGAGEVVPEVMARAERWARDRDEVEQAYVRLRVAQLRREVEQTASEASGYLDRGFLRWKARAQSAPGEHGSEWDDLMHRVRTDPGYARALDDTGVDTLVKGGVIAGVFVLVAVVGLALGPARPGVAVLAIGVLLLGFWVVFGIRERWHRGP